jgi:hypothetical protein
MSERGNQPYPNVLRKAGVALTAVGAMLGGVGCAAIDVLNEDYGPKCNPAGNSEASKEKTYVNGYAIRVYSHESSGDHTLPPCQ